MQYDFILSSIYVKYMGYNTTMYEDYVRMEKKYLPCFNKARQLKLHMERRFTGDELVNDLYRLGAIAEAWKEKHGITSSDLSFNKYGMIEFQDRDLVMKHLREVDDLKWLVWKVIEVKETDLYKDIHIETC